MTPRPSKAPWQKSLAVEEVGRVRARLQEAFPEKPTTLSARALIVELAPDIKRAMNNRYTLDQIAQRLSDLIAEQNVGKPKKDHITVSRHTIRGYIFGKDSVLKEPRVQQRLQELGLVKAESKTAPARKATAAATNVTRLTTRRATPKKTSKKKSA
jgi:hypothetical protein